MAANEHQGQDQHSENRKHHEKLHDLASNLCVLGKHRHRQHSKACETTLCSVSEIRRPLRQRLESGIGKLKLSIHLAGLALCKRERLRFGLVCLEQDPKRGLTLSSGGQRGAGSCERLVHCGPGRIRRQCLLANFGSLTLALSLEAQDTLFEGLHGRVPIAEARSGGGELGPRLGQRPIDGRPLGRARHDLPGKLALRLLEFVDARLLRGYFH